MTRSRWLRWPAAMQSCTAVACAVCNCCFCSRLSLQNTRQVCYSTLAKAKKSTKHTQTLPICRSDGSLTSQAHADDAPH